MDVPMDVHMILFGDDDLADWIAAVLSTLERKGEARSAVGVAERRAERIGTGRQRRHARVGGVVADLVVDRVDPHAIVDLRDFAGPAKRARGGAARRPTACSSSGT